MAEHVYRNIQDLNKLSDQELQLRASDKEAAKSDPVYKKLYELLHDRRVIHSLSELYNHDVSSVIIALIDRRLTEGEYNFYLNASISEIDAKVKQELKTAKSR